VRAQQTVAQNATLEGESELSVASLVSTEVGRLQFAMCVILPALGNSLFRTKHVRSYSYLSNESMPTTVLMISKMSFPEKPAVV
jgi:hypothetical protein